MNSSHAFPTASGETFSVHDFLYHTSFKSLISPPFPHFYKDWDSRKLNIVAASPNCYLRADSQTENSSVGVFISVAFSRSTHRLVCIIPPSLSNAIAHYLLFVAESRQTHMASP